MSRVIKPGNKFVNMTRYDSTITNPSKMVRIHSESENYHKARNLSSWLFMKYDMSYKAFRNKSKARRDEIKAEYATDTGNDIRTRQERKKDELIQDLKELGVQFTPDGEPIGYEWDDLIW